MRRVIDPRTLYPNEKPLILPPVWGEGAPDVAAFMMLGQELGANRLVDWRSGQNYALTGSTGIPAWKAAQYGLALAFVQANEQYVPHSRVVGVGNTPFTIMVRCACTYVSGSPTAYGQGTSAHANGMCAIRLNSATQVGVYYRDGTTSSTLSSKTATIANKTTPRVFTFTSQGNGGLIAVYEDGILLGTANNTTPTTNCVFDRAAVGAKTQNTNYVDFWNGTIEWVMEWSRCLSAVEVAARAQDPFVWAREPKRIYYSIASGGTRIRRIICGAD